jgi:hypothetical protein
MKNLKEFNVIELNNTEILNTHGGGIGRWLAQGIRAIGKGIVNAMQGQYNHVHDMVEAEANK